MAQDAPASPARLPSTPISPAIEDAIERTWPSSPPAVDAAPDDTTPFDVALRVAGFFFRIKEQMKLREAHNAERLSALPVVEVQPAPAPPPEPQPTAAPSSGPPDPLKMLGYAALGIGGAILIGKTFSAIAEHKQRQRQRQRRLADQLEEQGHELDSLHAALARHKALDARRRRQQRTLAQVQAQPAVVDTTALEPKLHSWVSETITKNFEAGMAVQHVHQHQHVQHVHPTTLVENIIERAVPGPRGARGDKADKGDKGDPGKDGKQGKQGKQGPRGSQGPRGPQGPKGNQGKRGTKGNRGKSGKAGRDGVAPLQGHQPKNSRGFFDD